jgi:hypothetical protein
MKRKTRRLNEKSALGLLEEAAACLRSSPPGLLAVYYLGTFPFVLGALFYWTDMSRSAFAEERVVSGALGVALLFLWMKIWQSVFCSLVRARLRGTSDPWDGKRVRGLILSQVTCQPTALFLLPPSLLLTLPFGWVYAFYQNVTVLGGEPGLDGEQLRRKAIRQARLWPGQNHLLLIIALLFGCIVFLNLGLALILAPNLLKNLLGIDTVFTLDFSSFLNTTFMAILAGLTYLCLDPLLKTVFTLRSFYGDSIESGEDLEVQARQFFGRRTRALPALISLFLGLFSGMTIPLQGQEKSALPVKNLQEVSDPRANQTLNPRSLDQAIEQVIVMPEYSWRFPRERRPDRERDPGFLSYFFQSIGEMLKSWFDQLIEILRKVAEWISKKLFQENFPDAQGGGGAEWSQVLRLVLLVLIVVSGAAIAFILIWTWRRRKMAGAIKAEPVRARPDLADENIGADELPRDEWIGLAIELLDQGELRLALRAFYLGGLAHLSHRDLIRLAKFKSNHEYELELRRRSRQDHELTMTFTQLVGIFERVWYGNHPVNRPLVDTVRMQVERIASC